MLCASWVGAEARELLRAAAAARRWRVPLGEIRAAGSVMYHDAKQLRASYSELVSDVGNESNARRMRP